MAAMTATRVTALRIGSRHMRTSLRQLSTIPFSSSDSDVADVVIAGGGMVGAAMACALAYSNSFAGKRIVLLEAASDRGNFMLPDHFSNRTCALSPATVSLLSRFGAWQEIEKMRCWPVRRMQVWESCSNAMITFGQEELMEPLAFIVENDVILAAILKCLEQAPVSVNIRYRTSALSFQMPGLEASGKTRSKHPWVTVSLPGGKEIKTPLLIGADGAQSAVRTAARFHTVGWNYKQTAVVATLQLSEITENTVAWQRFLPTGPIALLPLSNEHSSLIWTTTPEHADHLLKLSPDSFVDAVNDALWHDRDMDTFVNKAHSSFMGLLQSLIPAEVITRQLPPTVLGLGEGTRACFPLSLVHSSCYVRPRLALIGDAAHRLHPLAGQGVNLGFGDVSCLTSVLEDALSCGSDIGSLAHLLSYETKRQRNNLPVLATIDGLQRLYNTHLMPVVLLRSLGLSAVNAAESLKKLIVQRATA
ncbi:ubiquinone biosynthesis monooxygenase COQ6, mitochondrial-like [Pomacea canaliculata]|uniref:ubiquinone biosynthesis monooxygenase COQ6, mitochondrial-like n=1 Tax=Pomacea canaliculata TaxID=400727 RepID=UPI000D739C54|nr:ubiquinone biosynthesis monooxygenase COQ6, mitochondrial-like [Pomacea canaliculata]